MELHAPAELERVRAAVGRDVPAFRDIADDLGLLPVARILQQPGVVREDPLRDAVVGVAVAIVVGRLRRQGIVEDAALLGCLRQREARSDDERGPDSGNACDSLQHASPPFGGAVWQGCSKRALLGPRHDGIRLSELVASGTLGNGASPRDSCPARWPDGRNLFPRRDLAGARCVKCQAFRTRCCREGPS